MFLWNSCFFNDPVDVGSLISGSSAFSKSSLNIWKFTVYSLLKPGLENFEHYFARVWEECNCVIVWTFVALPFLGIGMKTDLFPVLWPLLSFLNLLAYWGQHFHSISCVVGRPRLLWPVGSLGKTLLTFAPLCFLFQGQICLLLQVSLDFLLFHSSPRYGKLIW